MTPIRAIRLECKDCMCGQLKEIRLCVDKDCPLYNFRFGKRIEKKSSLKAIKLKCLRCGENTLNYVKECSYTNCPLYVYRKGKNPSRKGIGYKNIILYRICKKNDIQPKK